jgi:hypothetical protein
MLTILPMIALASLFTPSPSTSAHADDADTLLAALRVPASQRTDWTTFRVAGDLIAVTTKVSDELYTHGPCAVTTTLPAGYPNPTPPGAVELKRYPSVRRAEYTGTGNNRMGRNIGFWPLFQHIQKHDIPMTSPVEMDFHSAKVADADAPAAKEPSAKEPDAAAPSKWTMSFLYRTADLNKTGTEGSVVVADAPPVTVISVGTRGSYSQDSLEDSLNILAAALAQNPDWRANGSPRALYYNGPDTRENNLWGEVQIPIVPRNNPGSAAGTSENTNATPGR